MNDEFWMELALSLAETAASLGEVPVGAVLISQGEILATGINLRELSLDPLGHAELMAIKKGCEIKKNWRLSDCTLYVTLEPCIMCAGSLHQSRIGRVVYGAKDPKGGALGSLYEINADLRLNHRYPAQEGLLRDRCSSILSQFFQKKRKTPT